MNASLEIIKYNVNDVVTTSSLCAGEKPVIEGGCDTPVDNL